MLHNYGTASGLSWNGRCRQIEHMGESVPEVRFNPNVSNYLVIVSVPAWADAFFFGVDKFLVALFTDKEKVSIAEERLMKLVQDIPLCKESADEI